MPVLLYQTKSKMYILRGENNLIDKIEYPEIVKKGIFCREDRYRFHCWVMVDEEEHLCYLPSNCKLEKMYSLKGRTVLLSQQKSVESKFDYKVEAVLFRNSQILLNLTFLNRVVEQEIHKQLFSFLGEREKVYREIIVDGYKSDLFIKETNTLIEIKSVLAFSNTVNYPANYSYHILQQLEKLCEIAKSQKKVYYFVVGLGPLLKTINIDLNDDFGKLADKCRRAGVIFVAMNLQSRKGEYQIKEFIRINYIGGGEDCE